MALIKTYVDDLIVAFKNDEKVAEIREKLRKEFETNYLEKNGHCLGIKFTSGKNFLHMNQKRYTSK